MDYNSRMMSAAAVIDTNTRIVELAASAAGADLLDTIRTHADLVGRPFPPRGIILTNNAATVARLADSAMAAAVGMPINPGDWVRLDIFERPPVGEIQYRTDAASTLIAMVLY